MGAENISRRINKTQMTLVALAEGRWCPGNSGVREILTVYSFLPFDFLIVGMYYPSE